MIISTPVRSLLPFALVVAAALPSDILAQSADEAPAPEPSEGTEFAPGDELARIPAPPPSVARRIARLIERIRAPMSPAERMILVDELVAEGERAIPLVYEEMQQSGPGQAVMVYVLGAFGDPRAIPALEKLAYQKIGAEKMEAIYALTLAGSKDAYKLALRSSHASVGFERNSTATDFILGVLGPEVVPEVVSSIPGRTSNARAAAISALGTIGDDRAVDFLLEWSDKDDGAASRLALASLARIGDPRAVERLRLALADPDLVVRRYGAEGLGYLKDPSAAAPLGAALAKEKDRVFRRKAIWALGNIATAESVAALGGLLEGADGETEGRVATALAATGHTDAIPFLVASSISAPERISRYAVNGLARMPGDSVRDHLLEVCQTASTLRARRLSTLALVERMDPRALPCVAEVLGTEIERRGALTSEALSILESLPFSSLSGATEILERLASQAKSEAMKYELRGAAEGIRSVGEIGTDTDAWIKLLQGGTPEEVDLAIDRLGRLGDPAAVQPLVENFGRLEPARSIAIPRALGRIGSERGTPFLVTLLSDDRYRLPSLAKARLEAARALASYSSSPHVAEALVESFRTERGTVVTPLIAFLRVTGPDGIDEALRAKGLTLRHRSPEGIERNEAVLWAIRQLRIGGSIDLDQFQEP